MPSGRARMRERRTEQDEHIGDEVVCRHLVGLEVLLGDTYSPDGIRRAVSAGGSAMWATEASARVCLATGQVDCC